MAASKTVDILGFSPHRNQLQGSQSLGTKNKMIPQLCGRKRVVMSEVGMGRRVVDLRKATGSEITVSFSSGHRPAEYTARLFILYLTLEKHAD